MLSSPYAVFQFSVYFHTILSKQSTPNDMKSWLTKAPEDYFGRSAFRCFHPPFKSRILSNSNAQIKPGDFYFIFLRKESGFQLTEDVLDHTDHVSSLLGGSVKLVCMSKCPLESFMQEVMRGRSIPSMLISEQALLYAVYNSGSGT